MPRSTISRWLIISDLQIPFAHIDALLFCRLIQKEYRIPLENVICVGDEVDQYFGSQYKKDPSINFSAAEEIVTSKKILKEWYKQFPLMKLCVSNHGMRWAKKACEAEIPSQMLRTYQEVLEAPKGWIWRDEWVIKSKYPWRCIHGLGYSSQAGARNAAIDAKMSTAIGHLHSHAGISFIHTMGSEKTLWGMNVGCLIDVDAFAFQYGKYSRHKPILGVGVVIDEGKTPIFIPFE